MDCVSPEDQGAEQRPPDVAQSPDDDDQKGFYDKRMVHAQCHAYRRGDKRSSQAGEKAADHEHACKNPAYINSHGSDHFPVYSRGAGNLSDFCPAD